MSAKKPQIDLSKCPIGTRLRLRNGEEVTLIRKGRNKVLIYPYFTSDGKSHAANGRVWKSKEDSRDIIAILPPAKAKKAGKPLKQNTLDRLASAFTKIAFKGDNDLIRKAADALEGLIKP